MSALTADLRRTMLAPAAVATLVLAVVLAALISAGPVDSGRGIAGFAVSYEYDDGALDLWLYVYNESGQPLGGIPATATLTPSGNNTTAGVPVLGSGTTARDGIAEVVVPSNGSAGSVSLSVNSSVFVSAEFQLAPAPPGTVRPAYDTLALVNAGRYGLSPEMLVFDPGPGGGAPTGASVEVEASRLSPSPAETVVDTSPLRAAVTILDVPVGALPPQTITVDYFVLGPGGTPLAGQGESPDALATLAYTAPYWGSVLAGEAGYWGFLAPVLGVGVGYAAYGRERTSRALEPVVALPTTRFRILVRRYSAGCLALGLDTGLVVLVGFTLRPPLASGLAPALLLEIGGSLLVGAVAFLGLACLLAHVVRSGGGGVALGVALAAFLAYFLVPLEFLVSGLRNSPYPSALQVQSYELVNPTSLPNATIAAYFAGLGSPGILPSGVVAGGTQLLLALGVTALLAVVAPILAAMLAVGRD